MSYKETLQKKRERLEALRSRRRDPDLSPTPVAQPLPIAEAAANSERQRKVSDGVNSFINSVMSSLTTEDTQEATLSEKDEEDEEVAEIFSSKKSTKCLLSRTELLHEISYPPKELISYSKESQTLEENIAREYEEAEGGISTTLTFPESGELQEREEESERKTTTPPAVAPGLSDTEKAVITESESFLNFLNRSSRITERLLAENVTPDDVTKFASEEDSVLSLDRTFFEDRRCRHRAVTGLQWSPTFSELLATSYSANDSGLTESDGLVLVWNMKYRKDSPEMQFHSPSPTLSVSFTEFSPHILVAGTYSGQVMLWDSRNRKQTPVMKSPLSTKSHTAPVYCVRTMGTSGAEKIVTLSSDGVLCNWALEQLSAPMDRLVLRPNRVDNFMTPTCFDYFNQDVSKFVFGSEDGSVFLAYAQHPFRGIKENFKSHMAPVTGISTHNSDGPIDFYHLFLTSSMDWSVTLWSTRDRRPLRTFYDPLGYIYDVKWSPKHPAIFAAVNDNGNLDLWNLNHDQEVSVARLRVRGDEPTALNKLTWHASGTQIATGDAHGRAHVCSLPSELALASESEWTDLDRSLKSIRATSMHGYLEDSSLFTETNNWEEESSFQPASRTIRAFFGNTV